MTMAMSLINTWFGLVCLGVISWFSILKPEKVTIRLRRCDASLKRSSKKSSRARRPNRSARSIRHTQEIFQFLRIVSQVFHRARFQNIFKAIGNRRIVSDEDDCLMNYSSIAVYLNIMYHLIVGAYYSIFWSSEPGIRK